MYKTLSIPQLTVIIPFLNEGGEGFGYGEPYRLLKFWMGRQSVPVVERFVGWVSLLKSKSHTHLIVF